MGIIAPACGRVRNGSPRVAVPIQLITAGHTSSASWPECLTSLAVVACRARCTSFGRSACDACSRVCAALAPARSPEPLSALVAAAFAPARRPEPVSNFVAAAFAPARRPAPLRSFRGGRLFGNQNPVLAEDAFESHSTSENVPQGPAFSFPPVLCNQRCLPLSKLLACSNPSITTTPRIVLTASKLSRIAAVKLGRSGDVRACCDRFSKTDMAFHSPAGSFAHVTNSLVGIDQCVDVVAA